MTDPTNPFQNRNDIMRDAAYKCGFNDALEQVAKWMDELEIDRISGYEAIEQVAAHVRNMKKP